VCIAGVVAFGPLVELTDETLVELVETNLLGPVRLMRAAVPRLREAVAAGRGGGRAPGGAFVLNVSAVIAESPVAGMAAYGASKAGLWAFDAAMARELRSARIRVVDARPPHTESGLADHPIAGTAPQLPRGLRPDDVARRLVEAIVSGERDLPSASFTA
jgi:NAD(P)-dependent dehydrogenase (short-subunit alcohol dehydrogenase family)